MISAKNYHNKYYKFLEKTSIFKDIDTNDLVDFLETIKIKQYRKGEMVTFDSQEHAKCYIVFDGLFKLTRVDERGDEIVIALVDKKDIVSPMHYSKHYDICAEFVKNTTLIYFNKDEIERFTEKSHQFSTNIITYLAGNVQKLMVNAEVLQLKSAKEKVGWYLVHSKINNTFRLPYSKSLIASYLGIKPESFSRALILLKEEGISLANKTINLESGDELCKYCDKVTGSSCRSFESEGCAHA
ncbi:Crp/Fnr family transcriptional regulator [Candidatus Thioglobus sp.]|jgi:CRP-like cAMP-binding protein|uniref:Crp/Fnr family transcriptional regulator n=1 Tax=Candidatus Thioglobus sp. TaxID=2026721 RepID=UPI001D62BC9E|nr:Crp/Fnr family transcriptional regulator [Candidatus Thioglobus sp.]MBT3276388.1 Crp/Fnr family transcriptional regulator [Candidatus Thioglobus sp.]MBT3744652.1 Crp/Fnr family transcriptional regulator [Candidatus Thioglobus sp.]MBT4001293.1 Crp/Fnr family transcriptional regulator [Candidatus Thioglobus sp.]MBT4182380.1 Crp/Fnr family transcriptional regulator [Candidatus Thioglobus sp.]MBT4746527.1 Crp/Fnr family transcriptional regulator [Candidatus Thioglobus sp.]